MACPECKSTRVEPLRDDPIRTGGASFWPRQCKACGYVWSEPKPLGSTLLRKVEPLQVIVPDTVATADLPPVKGVDPTPLVGADTVEAGTAEADAAEAADCLVVEPCDPDDLQVGDVIEYERKGERLRAPVASNRRGAASLQVDVPRKPDRRIKKRDVRGRVVNLAE